MHERTVFGRAGEQLAAGHLERNGCTILDRNWRCAEGEIDLVVRRGRQLIFCEVKARRSLRWGAPSEAVSWRKQARLRHLAGRWMREHRVRAAEIRFDVVSIVACGGRVELEHIRGAF
jgi:putative endonuclease